MAIGDIIGGVGKFIFGDNSKSRDKMNEQNWNDYNDALTNYYGAQAYQSALKNYAEDNPEEWKKASKYFDGAMSDNFLKGYGEEVGNARQNFEKNYTKNRFKEFGEGGIINETLNPMMQVLSIPANALSGLNGGEFDNWSNNGSYRNRRDITSDIGALGETAFNIAGMGTLGDAVKGGAKLMSNVGKTALRTGALGAGENAFSTMREQGQDTNWDDVALSGAVGGAIGGGLGAISQFGGNAASMAKNLRGGNAKQIANAYADYLAKKNSAITDTARLLGDGAGGATVGTQGTYFLPNELRAAMQRMDTPLAKTKLGRVAQGVADSRAIYGSPLSSIANSRLGQTTKNILKTPYGKIGAGVGGGLLVANLLRGNGQPAQDMSDAELEQLMNYYNGGY